MANRGKNEQQTENCASKSKRRYGIAAVVLAGFPLIFFAATILLIQTSAVEIPFQIKDNDQMQILDVFLQNTTSKEIAKEMIQNIIFQLPLCQKHIHQKILNEKNNEEKRIKHHQ